MARVVVVPGDPRNLKVTGPADLMIAAALPRGVGDFRVGLGYDVHPFGAGDAPARARRRDHRRPPGSSGHSDADAVCHAVADALLGPAGLPDLGTLFPASDEQLPRRVVARAAARRGGARRRRRAGRS